MNLLKKGHMSKEDLEKWCKEHDLRGEDAAKVLGVSRSTAFKYLSGEQPIRTPIAYSVEAIDLLSKKERGSLFAKRLSNVKRRDNG